MALTTWRTILLGVPFEIYFDHDSLKYLFTQKVPSQRILQLCEFLADYDFTEIKYVPGPENVVPDVLSHPWEPSAPMSPIHMLVTGSHDRRSLLQNLWWPQPPSVLVRPVWKGQVAVQDVMGHRDFGVLKCIRAQFPWRWPCRQFEQSSWTPVNLQT